MLSGICPEFIKKRVRPYLFGYGKSNIASEIWFEKEDSRLVLNLEGIRAVFADDCWKSLEYHLRLNADSVEEIHSFVRHSKQLGGLLVDVGAADGLFSVLHACADQGNRAIAFEPGNLFGVLAKNIALNGLVDRVDCRTEAVGESGGIIIGGMNESGMFVVGENSQGEGRLQTTCLDGLLREGIRPTIVKVDVEGYEYEVLNGARALLAECKPVIFLELHLDILEARGKKPMEVLSALSELGYGFQSHGGRHLTQKSICQSPKAIIRFVATPVVAAKNG